MNSPLLQIIYISAAGPDLTEDALLEILACSQQRNQARDITGLLLHADGSIIQVMEGPERNVRKLYTTIASDPRHTGVTLMSCRSIEKRDFPNFKMGFKRACRQELEAQLPGFTNIVEERGVTKENLEGLSSLVAVFIRNFAKSTKIDRFAR
jgi:acylphosphatase